MGSWGGKNLYHYSPNPVQWIDPLGWVHESVGGYNFYGLFDKGADKPYYVGITDDLSRRRVEHVGTGRLTPVARMKALDTDVTYGQARGYEQAYIDHYGTKTGTVGEEISATNRGNRINSFDRNNTTRRASRQADFEADYKAKQAAQTKMGAGGCG